MRIVDITMRIVYPKNMDGGAACPMELQQEKEIFMLAAKTFEEQMTIEWLSVDALAIDMEYQRHLAFSKVKQISSKFDKNAVGVLIVSLRADGSYFICDGQHRWAGARKSGITSLECKVIRGLTKAQEAQLFIDCNTVRGNPEALDIFRARLITKDPVALEINAIIERCGLNIQFHPQGNRPGRTRPPKSVWAITAIEEIYIRGKEALLEEVLKLAMNAWPNNGHAFEAKVLSGIAGFHLKYQGRYTRQDFIDKMAITDLTTLRQRAQYFAENHGGSMSVTFTRALQEAYDKGRRTRRLEEKEGFS